VKRAVTFLLSALVLFSAGAARAEEKDEAKEKDFGHGGQFGLRAGLVGGYRMIFRYDTSPYCRPYDAAEAQQPKSCGHGAPLATELALSYGLVDFIEPYVWMRLGLSREDETDTDAVQILGLGARIYTMSDSAFKIFLEPAIAYEYEGGGGNPDAGVPATYDPEYQKDLLFHLAAGPHFDFHENVGAYLDAGLTTGIFRGIHSTLELHLGVQGRLP
jgi:hypothetical protein